MSANALTNVYKVHLSLLFLCVTWTKKCMFIWDFDSSWCDTTCFASSGGLLVTDKHAFLGPGNTKKEQTLFWINSTTDNVTSQSKLKSCKVKLYMFTCCSYYM